MLCVERKLETHRFTRFCREILCRDLRTFPQNSDELKRSDRQPARFFGCMGGTQSVVKPIPTTSTCSGGFDGDVEGARWCWV